MKFSISLLAESAHFLCSKPTIESFSPDGSQKCSNCWTKTTHISKLWPGMTCTDTGLGLIWCCSDWIIIIRSNNKIGSRRFNHVFGTIAVKKMHLIWQFQTLSCTRSALSSKESGLHPPGRAPKSHQQAGPTSSKDCTITDSGSRGCRIVSTRKHSKRQFRALFWQGGPASRTKQCYASSCLWQYLRWLAAWWS